MKLWALKSSGKLQYIEVRWKNRKKRQNNELPAGNHFLCAWSIRTQDLSVVNPSGKIALIYIYLRLDFQTFCAPAFFCAHHGWITGLPYCVFDQSETCLHESCRQVSLKSVSLSLLNQSCQQQRWRLSLWKNFLLPIKSVSELFKIGKFGKFIKKY